MITLDIKGTLGKFGYSNIPDSIAEDIIKIVTDVAYATAVKRAPYDPEPDGVHIRDDLQKAFYREIKTGVVWIKSPYGYIAEFGSRHRLAHPYIRPASIAAKNKMKAVIRVSTKRAVDKEKS